MLYKKILVASSLLVVLFMLYLIPTKKEVEFAETNLEYVYPNDLETVYLLDSNDYVARVLISASNDSIISKATSLIDALTIGGKKENVIPNGFRSIIPSGTKVNDIELEDGVLVINFSKEPTVSYIDIRIGYEEDVNKVINLLEEKLVTIKDSFPQVIEGPNVIGVSELANQGMIITITLKTIANEQYSVKRAINKFVKEIFDENNIKIAYDQVVVHNDENNN